MKNLITVASPCRDAKGKLAKESVAVLVGTVGRIRKHLAEFQPPIMLDVEVVAVDDRASELTARHIVDSLNTAKDGLEGRLACSLGTRLRSSEFTTKVVELGGGKKEEIPLSEQSHRIKACRDELALQALRFYQAAVPVSGIDGGDDPLTARIYVVCCHIKDASFLATKLSSLVVGANLSPDASPAEGSVFILSQDGHYDIYRPSQS